MTDDRIEREIVIAAPVERVWAVLTKGEHVGTWFGTGAPAKIDLRPGGTMLLDHGEHGVFPATIVTVDRPTAFSYFWAHLSPGERAHEGNATLVEFTLSPENGGTRLRVVESGFTRLPVPPDQQRDATERNLAGWAEIIENLRTYTERLVA